MKSYLKFNIKRFIYFIKSIFTRSKKKNVKISYIVERKNWAIRWDGINISRNINLKSKKPIIDIENFPYNSRNPRIIHFGSQYMWLDFMDYIPKKHKVVVNFYHGKKDDGDSVKSHIDKFLENTYRLDKIITASSLVERRLINWGIEREKIIKIPIGVDTSLFKIFDQKKQIKLREKFKFEKDDLIIGSFQKDGEGWGKGEIPKYIKGPDIFVETVSLLSKKYKVAVLLTGPARGYVIDQFKKRKIKYRHIFLDDYQKIRFCYAILDLYIVTSREEGGPKGIMESMASGVPIVSTNVGMASDLIRNGENGFISNKICPKEIALKCEEMLALDKEKITKQARFDVLRTDWTIVAKEHMEKVYLPLLKEVKDK